MEMLKKVHTGLAAPPQIHTPSSAQVNFLVRQTQFPVEIRKNTGSWSEQECSGTQGMPLYLKLRSYLNLHELSRVDAR